MMQSLDRRTLETHDLSNLDVFEQIIVGVHGDMIRIVGVHFTLLSVILCFNVMRNRFYDFLNFTNLPGVHFSTQNRRLEITAEYQDASSGVIIFSSQIHPDNFTIFVITYV